VVVISATSRSSRRRRSRAESAVSTGGGGGAPERCQHLDLIAAGRADQEDAHAIDRRHPRGFRGGDHAELSEQRVAPAAFDFHGRDARERADAGVQLGILDR
jgi:hypothetical protein